MTSSNRHQTKHPPTPSSNKKNESEDHKATLENTPTLPGNVSEEITGHEPTLEMPHTRRSRSAQ